MGLGRCRVRTVDLGLPSLFTLRSSERWIPGLRTLTGSVVLPEFGGGNLPFCRPMGNEQGPAFIQTAIYSQDAALNFKICELPEAVCRKRLKVNTQ